jgi:DNA-binding NarL/FixJ family response regulator
MVKATRVLVANRPKLMREVMVEMLACEPGIEVVGEVPDESQILTEVRNKLPDLLVIALDEAAGRPPICDRVLSEYPQVRIIAVASQDNRSVCYWASFDIHSDDIESSVAGILRAVRQVSQSGVVS